jgi:hypothetical protein
VRRQLRVFMASMCSLLSMFLIITAAHSTQCKCRQHNADAEANGTCSRTEDEKRCSLCFTTTTPEEYRRFVSQLQNLGLKTDPREVLSKAAQMPPESHGSLFVSEYLPILFSISQRVYFEDRTPQIVKAIRSNQKVIEEILLNPEYKRRAVKQQLSNFDATISYGCVEIKEGNFYSMVKTRWSEGVFFCNDFPK